MRSIRAISGSVRCAAQPAANRLLAGTPLHATSGNLTASELIIEAGLRRDVVYRDHKDLVEDYHARARARTIVPDRIRDVTAERDRLKAGLTETAEELRQEQHTTSTLRRVVTELSLELHQAHEQHTARQNVSPLLRPARTSRQPRTTDIHPSG